MRIISSIGGAITTDNLGLLYYMSTCLIICMGIIIEKILTATILSKTTFLFFEFFFTTDKVKKICVHENSQGGV